jgi:hypothetical protein
LNGARVGDLFMTLIHTAELHKIEPFHYLVSLLRHSAKVALDPAAGMPWNYTAAPAQPVLTFTASTQRSGCPSGESAGFRQTGPIRYGHASGLRAQVPD